MKKSYKLWMGIGLSSIYLTGCAKSSDSTMSNISSASSAYLTEEKVSIDEEVLVSQGQTPLMEASGKVSSLKGQSPSKRKVLRRGTKLMGVVDTECSEKEVGGISREIQIANGEPKRLRVQAYSFDLNTDTDLEQLKQDADSDSCLLQIANDVEVHLAASPNDPSFRQQWHHTALESAASYDVFYGSSGIQADAIVAVIDSGVNYNHPDLKDNMWKSSSGSFGSDFVNRDQDPMDDNGHGTHVAGIVGAVRNNSVGVTGVMGSRVKIMSVKVMNSSGAGSTSAVVNGINYAVENGANVINLSLGHQGTSSAMRTALVNAVNRGVTVVIAAGNDGAQLTSTNWYSPASYAREFKGVLAVGATSSSGSKASYSNYGADYVEVAAPGSSIYSTLRNGSYGSMSGTSMASPVVAGAAGLTVALLKSRGITPTPALVEKLLLDGSSKISNLTSQFTSGNRLNLRSLAQTISTYAPVANPQPQPAPTPVPAPQPAPAPTPVAAPQPAPVPQPVSECGPISGAACEVFKGINAQRRANGLSDLKPLASCQKMAQAHSQDMAANNYLSHTSPTQGTFYQRAGTFGVTGGLYGENIAYGYTTSSVVTAWMNSSGHRANILNRSYQSTGIGYALNSSGRPFYTQCFSSKVGE